MLVMLRVLD